MAAQKQVRGVDAWLEISNADAIKLIDFDGFYENAVPVAPEVMPNYLIRGSWLRPLVLSRQVDVIGVTDVLVG